MKKTTLISSKKNFPLLTGLGFAILLATTSFFIHQRPAIAADIVVYKSPTCGCCKKWVDHLESNGYSVEIHNQTNLTPIKAQAGVPSKLQGCHTAKIGQYIIEGHVPADVIARLLKEKPDIKGLAVPGMPMGSPGMEGARKEAYQVISFTDSGALSVYAER